MNAMPSANSAPLWGADNQNQRLKELTAGTADAAKEIPLRRDVRSLGMLLGKVLVEQAGDSLLEVVEQLRRLLIQQREQLPAGAQQSGAENALMAEAREIIARAESGRRLPRHQSVCHLFRADEPGGNKSSQAPPPRGQVARRTAAAGRLISRHAVAHARRGNFR